MNERSHLLGEQPDGFWARRTTLGKALIILSMVALLALIVVAIVLTVSKTPSDDPTPGTSTISPTDAPTGTPVTTPTPWTTTTLKPVITICQTEMCKNEADRLTQTMDLSVDPCEDFYQYSCGGYIKNHKLPDDKGRYGTFDASQENVIQRLSDLYARDYLPKEIKPLQFVRHLYQSCNDTDVLENRGVDPLVKLLDSLGGWPFGQNNSTYNNFTYNWKKPLQKIVSELGNSILVDVSVIPDPNNTAQYIIAFDQPKFGVGREDLLNFHNDTKSKTLIDAYKAYIKSTAKLFNDNATEFDEYINEVVEFEAQLARFSASPEDRRDHRAMYHKTTFEKLSFDIMEVDWFAFMQGIYEMHGSKVRIAKTDEVVIFDYNYLKSLSKYLYEFSISNRTTVANYLGWRVLQENGFMTTESFRNNEFEFLKVRDGIQKEEPLWKKCLNLVSDQVPALVGRTYIDTWFTEEDVNAAALIVKFLETAFSNGLNEKKWLDGETKDRALRKLRMITSNVGYPLWVKNDTFLLDFIKLTNDVDKQDPFKSALYMRSVVSQKMFEKVHRKVYNEYEWPMGPAVVNAAYEPSQNSITIPAGILQLVFFNETRPAYLNYGSIGSIIGHEITHGFDDEGAQYDEYGNLVNWWSNATHVEFNKRARCFVEQYGSIHDDRVDMNLNGKHTQGENIADNGGLRQAYEAYQLHEVPLVDNGILPGFENYTVEQLFFVSYANNWCSLIRDEKLRQNILYDPHSPAKYRVNVPLSNYEKFAEAFQCSANSKMAPTNRCVLW